MIMRINIDKLQISAIVAMANNIVIGFNGDIPWRGKLKGEQLLFKKYTKGKIVIMGKNTWHSIPQKYRPLPDRGNIVLTSAADYFTKDHLEFDSIEQALFYCSSSKYSNEVVFIGGQRVYEECLKYCNRLYISNLDVDYQGDTFFPKIKKEEWRLNKSVRYEGNKINYTFNILDRIK